MKFQKLKLRSRRDNIPASPFNALVAEAVEVVQRLRALDHDPAAGKITAQAFLKEVMKLDERISLKSIKKLRQALEKNPPQLTHSNATLRRTISALRGPNFSHPPPAKNLDRTIRWLNTEPAIAEQIRFGCSQVELICVAVQIAGENHPEVFGKRDSSAEIVEERDELTAKRDELYKRIATEATLADDLLVDDTGTGPIRFKLAPEVGLTPKASAAERLVNHLLARPSEQMRQVDQKNREREQADLAKRDQRIAGQHDA